MLRLALAIALLLAIPGRAAESEAARVEKEYREKRQAALAGQWMEIKMPWETPAAYLARLLDTAREGDSRATAALGWEFHQRGDKERAQSWLGKSAERGNRFAAYLLGLMPPELIKKLGVEIPTIRRDPHWFIPTTGTTYAPDSSCLGH